VTSLYVTHDQQEAFAIADRVVIMNAGRIEQVGQPLAVYRQPASPFVARFLGMHNLLPGQVTALVPAPLVATPLGLLHWTGGQMAANPGQHVVVVVRPDAASLDLPVAGRHGGNLVHGPLLDASFRGSQVKITVGYAADAHLVFELPGSAANDLPALGQTLRLALDPAGISLLPAGSNNEHVF
jgi:ABC-type Fe3+/spermidine/putrescine transport system ATPase subunit